MLDTVAMQITGHKTSSVFKRYDITTHDDTRAAGQQVYAFVTGAGDGKPAEKQSGTVRQFKRQANR